MKSGLLWHDIRLTKEFDLVLNQAVTRYEKKFGIKPDMCYVNPRHISKVENVNGIEIRTKKTIMPNHIWLGTKE